MRPRTSKGITDLLSLSLVRLFSSAACPSKKSLSSWKPAVALVTYRDPPATAADAARFPAEPAARRARADRERLPAPAGRAPAARRDADGATAPDDRRGRRANAFGDTGPGRRGATRTRARTAETARARAPRAHRRPGFTRLVSRTESRSLSELTRQIAPPTKNGHAPPPTESRKSSQSVNLSGVRAW